MGFIDCGQLYKYNIIIGDEILSELEKLRGERRFEIDIRGGRRTGAFNKTN